MNKVWREACEETEAAIYCIVRDAKLLSCASAEVIEHNREWIEEARERLNDALAKIEREVEAA